MASESDKSPTQLRQAVTSPRGTTEQAILSFQAAQLETRVDDAMQACARRSVELAQLLRD
jgi:pyrroline-5-carboxylate reductase